MDEKGKFYAIVCRNNNYYIEIGCNKKPLDFITWLTVQEFAYISIGIIPDRIKKIIRKDSFDWKKEGF